MRLAGAGWIVQMEKYGSSSVSAIVARGCGRSETAVVMIRRAIRRSGARWRIGRGREGADFAVLAL